MNNTTILKLINLLDENNTQEIKEILTAELLKADKQPLKAKFFATVKKFLNDKTIINNERTQLKTIMHKHGKQFICNGIELYVFNSNKEELQALPQTSEEETQIDYTTILNIDHTKLEPLNSNDIFVLENIDKYINYFKATQQGNKDIFVPFSNYLFDTKLLKNYATIHGGDFSNIKQQKRNFAFVTSNNDIESVILPLMPDESKTQKYNKIFDDFKNSLTANNKAL